MESMKVPELISLNYNLDRLVCNTYSSSFPPFSACLVLCLLNVYLQDLCFGAGVSKAGLSKRRGETKSHSSIVFFLTESYSMLLSYCLIYSIYYIIFTYFRQFLPFTAECDKMKMQYPFGC